ncbi:sigma-70 family RNA polymerase sigma factor [Phenylobacterium sp.]|uniref:RNA polymerase sigma factor n=1 Tax=Phenylobacterium sp. TaxID=1871053 RepID=UPI0026275AE1|nr:sigma-70 family RNA polymerase sigma factor [Phenylobacterium sp.]
MSALQSSIQISDQAAPWEVLTFCPSLRAFFRNKAPDDEIDDLIQEVMIRMHGRDAGGIDNLEHYVIRVARNVLRDRYRRDQVRRRQDHCELLEHDHPPDDMSPERILRAREQLATTLQAMDELPERSRTILVLLRWEGMSYSEVAELLDISVSAVQKHVTRSMRHLMARVLERHESQADIEPRDSDGPGRRRRMACAPAVN